MKFELLFIIFNFCFLPVIYGIPFNVIDKLKKFDQNVRNKGHRIKRSEFPVPLGESEELIQLSPTNARNSQFDDGGGGGSDDLGPPSPSLRNSVVNFQPQLLNEMKAIIPGKFAEHHEPKPHLMTESDKELQLMLKVIKMVQLMSNKLHQKYDHDPEKKEQLIKMDKLAQKITEDHKKHKKLNKLQLHVLADLLTDFFDEKPDHHKILNHNTPGTAPFCELGQDCFKDVDHKMIAYNIKKLALEVADYMYNRIQEEKASMFRHDDDESISGRSEIRHGSEEDKTIKYRTDAIITKTTTVIAKLHRAILRNWHHILMIIGNLSGEKNLKLLHSHSDVDDTHKIICEMELPAKTDMSVNNMDSCEPHGGHKWFELPNCDSAISHPKTECKPPGVNNFVPVKGKYQGFRIGKAGIWDFSLNITVDPSEVDKGETKDLLIVHIDRIKSGMSDHLVSLSKLGQTVNFHGIKEVSNHEIKASGHEHFNKGDIILVRLRKTKGKIKVAFSMSEMGASDKPLVHHDDDTGALDGTEDEASRRADDEDIDNEVTETPVDEVTETPDDEVTEATEDDVTENPEDDVTEPSDDEVTEPTDDTDDEGGEFTHGAEDITEASGGEVEVTDETPVDGDDATGDDETGDETTRDETTGDETTDDETTGDETTGDETTGDETTDDETTGDETTGDETTGDETTDDETALDDDTGDESGGEKTYF